MVARTTTPPATPPAIAAVFDPLPEDDEEEALDLEALEVGLAFPEVEALINEPGPSSGATPAMYALVAFQRFSKVLSTRAHCGTLVPRGTGLGNTEGGSVLVQLNEYSDQVVHTDPWHASQALMRLYVTVLHLQGFASSTSLLGPVYEYPGCSAFMVNVPPLHVDIRNAAIVHIFWPRELNDHFQDALQSGARI